MLQQRFIRVMIACGFIVFIYSNYLFYTNQQYFHLAESFLHKKLYFDSPPVGSEWDDASLYQGNYYWPLGIFPAFLLVIPRIILGIPITQGIVSFFLNILNFFLLYKLSMKFTKNRDSSLLLAFAYMFSSAYIMVGFAPFSWYYAHVVATSGLLLSLYFILIKDKPILAGLFFSFAFLTRISIILGIIFFLLYFYHYKKDEFINKCIKFIIPVLFSVIVFFVYNYTRFDNIFETGYKYQILPERIAGNRDYKLWSLKHYPANLYLFILSAPLIKFEQGTFILKKIATNRLGMSFIFTSPIFLWLAFADMRKKLNKISAVSALAIALFLFGSYGLGAYQFGYRFALDFQPFLFLILLDVFAQKKTTIGLTLFVYLSFVFNIFMCLSHFELW